MLLVNIVLNPIHHMNVYITYTEGYSEKKINKIIEILNKSNNEISFKKSNSLRNEYLAYINPKFSIPNLEFSLSFLELFNICALHRSSINQVSPDTISENDFVVLITPIRNNDRWFSAVNNGRNLFIHSESFIQNTDRDEEFGIAYNILVNIFQSLVGVNYDTLEISSIVHKKSIGCINDYCKNKSDIILKLRTGYICDSCLDKAINENVSPQLLLHIHSLLQSIREEFMNLKRIKVRLTLDNIVIDSRGKIYIGNTNLGLTAIEKTLYYFYLTHLDGFETGLFSDLNIANELYAIYRTFYDGARVEPIKNLCHFPGTNDSTYSRNKTEIHRKIKDKLGNVLSNYYKIITEPQERARICRIKPEQYKIVIDPEFTNKINNSKNFISTYRYRIILL